MSSNSPNTNTPRKLFVHRDYEYMAEKPAHIILHGRQAAKDSLEPMSADGQGFEFFDLDEFINEMETTQNIYFTDETDEIIGFLVDQPREIARIIYGKIGKKICKKYLGTPSADLKKIISNLKSGLTEIEIMTRNDVVTDIRLGSFYDEVYEDEDGKDDSDEKGDKDDSDKETSISN